MFINKKEGDSGMPLEPRVIRAKVFFKGVQQAILGNG